jgi:hypothetical protein
MSDSHLTHTVNDIMSKTWIVDLDDTTILTSDRIAITRCLTHVQALAICHEHNRWLRLKKQLEQELTWGTRTADDDIQFAAGACARLREAMYG